MISEQESGVLFCLLNSKNKKNDKKILTAAVLVLLSVCLFGQQIADPVQIKGELKLKAENVRLYKVSEGRIVEIANTTVAKTESSAFCFFRITKVYMY